MQRPGDQLLARAGFAEQQCRAVGLSHFLQQPERCAQRRAVSDDVLESDDRGARRHDGRLGTFTQPRPQTRDFNVGVVEHLLDPSPRERRGDDSCDGPQPFDHLVRPAARLIHEPGGQRARPHTVETRHDQTDDHGRPQRHPRQRLLGDGGQIVDRQIVRDVFDGEGFPSVVPPVDISRRRGTTSASASTAPAPGRTQWQVVSGSASRPATAMSVQRSSAKACPILLRTSSIAGTTVSASATSSFEQISAIARLAPDTCSSASGAVVVFIASCDSGPCGHGQ